MPRPSRLTAALTTCLLVFLTAPQAGGREHAAGASARAAGITYRLYYSVDGAWVAQPNDSDVYNDLYKRGVNDGRTPHHHSEACQKSFTPAFIIAPASLASSHLGIALPPSSYCLYYCDSGSNWTLVTSYPDYATLYQKGLDNGRTPLDSTELCQGRAAASGGSFTICPCGTGPAGVDATQICSCDDYSTRSAVRTPEGARPAPSCCPPAVAPSGCQGEGWFAPCPCPCPAAAPPGRGHGRHRR
jgi:hypothetical protein